MFAVIPFLPNSCAMYVCKPALAVPKAIAPGGLGYLALPAAIYNSTIVLIYHIR
jgi:hypothetical protein